ncbi:hypothetical protein KAX75_08135 [candidate division WOR-3 bacterium]|nr:hypothetical protein [candidate division WOR-3 bacterium]
MKPIYAKRANLKRNLFIGFFIILFVLLVFDKNLHAVVFCAVVFLFTSAIAIRGFIKRLENKKQFSQLTGREVRKKEFLILMIFGSFFSAIISLVRGFFPKILVGIYLFIILLVFFTNGVKRIISKKRLPLLLKYLQMDPSIKNFEKVIDAHLSINDFANASKYAYKAIEQYPDSAVLLTWRAIVYRRLEKDEKAVPLIKKALEIEPRNKFVRNEASGLQSLGFKVFPPPKRFWKLWP